MDKVCAIISGGEFSPAPEIKKADYIIACDKGIGYAPALGVVPDLIVGDFDSYSGPLPGGIPVHRLPVEKDDTDTMSAMRCAIDSGYERIIICCALGGRLDHLLANIQTGAFGVKAGCKVDIVSRDCKMRFFTQSTEVFPKLEGYSLSVFSLSDECENVTVRGTKYTLDNAVLKSTFPVGTSNQWAEDTAAVGVGKGILLVMCCAGT